MTNIDSDTPVSDISTCLGCNYDLRGLREETRCPECGLLNIPDAYRKQIWELVDSGKWSFSGFFNPFRKRLPGWWWALDRDGDLQRASRAAYCNVFIALFIVVLCYVTTDVCMLEITDAYGQYAASDPNGPPLFEKKIVSFIGHCQKDIPWRVFTTGQSSTSRTDIFKQTQSMRWVVYWRWHAIPHALIVCSWIVALWAFTAMVGLWTQIRKGLPDYARAPRTILAATCYETHRLIYVALLLSACTLIQMPLRPTFASRFNAGNQGWIPVIESLIIPLFILIQGAFGAAGWIGPIRSDYTKQLIRSRRHAIRIIIMYALIFPGVLAGTAYLAVDHLLCHQ